MKKNILRFSCLLITLMLSLQICEAASFSISVGSKSLTKGSTTKLTIKGVDATGRFNITSSNSGVASISESAVWIENNSYTINISALNVGTSTITVTAADVSDSSGNAVSLGSKTISISVSLPREKSNDNNLKSLNVEGYEISPAFESNVTNYSVTVKEGTKTINVIATPSSGYAKVSGNGTVSLIEGINNLSIVVTSETGIEKVYNLVVNVIDENPINVSVAGKNYTVVKLKENITCPTFFTESEQVVSNIPVPSCRNDLIDYTLIGLKDEEGNIKLFSVKDNEYYEYHELNSKNLGIININYDEDIAGYEKTKLDINGVTFDAYKSSSDRFLLIYGKNIETGEEGIYVYDNVNETLSLYYDELIDNLENTNQKYLYIIIIFGIGFFLSIICIINLNSKKSSKSKKSTLLEEEIEENIVDSKKNKKSKKKNVE